MSLENSRPRVPDISRFWSKVVKTDSCWIWTACTEEKGYGQFRYDNRLWSAHRFAYEHFVGPIGGLHVLHRCDNPPCVNPDHLFLGTNQENRSDSVVKGRHVVPNMISLEKKRLIFVELIRDNKYGRYSRAARKFGITRHTAASIEKQFSKLEV